MYGARQGVETVGMLLAFAVMQVISGAQDARAQALWLTPLLAVGAGLLLLWTPLLLRERPAHLGRGGRGLRAALTDVVRNTYGPLVRVRVVRRAFTR